jgi:hypothetical protein
MLLNTEEQKRNGAPVSGDGEEGCNAGVATFVRLLSTISPAMPTVPFFLFLSS